MTKQTPIVRTFDDHQIQFNHDGWFNATEAAAKFGKAPNEWMRLPTTFEYLSALERKYGKIPYLKTKKGQGGGTWLHPKLAVAFARWLDVDFAIWCDEQIDSIIRDDKTLAHSRHQASVTYKMMSDMLNMTRKEQGKETQAHHYTNEAKLVNWAFGGEFKGLERESLCREDLDLLAYLEERNALLIGRGVDYDKRKPMLQQYALDWRLERTIIKLT